MTDSKGKVVDFKNCVIIMTSNVGAHQIGNQAKIGFGQEESNAKEHEQMRERIMTELKNSFRPEFLNRIDDIIVFHKLDEKDTEQIAKLMLESIGKRLAERDVYLTYTNDALLYLAKEGFDKEYGARPLRRIIQQIVEDQLSEEILEGKVKLGDKVKLYIKDGKPAFKRVKEAEEAKAE